MLRFRTIKATAYATLSTPYKLSFRVDMECIIYRIRPVKKFMVAGGIDWFGGIPADDVPNGVLTSILPEKLCVAVPQPGCDYSSYLITPGDHTICIDAGEFSEGAYIYVCYPDTQKKFN